MASLQPPPDPSSIRFRGWLRDLWVRAATSLEKHAIEHVTGGTDVIPNAVPTGNSGLMSGTDKAKLNGIEALADVTDAVNIASSIVGVADKAIPYDTDSIGLIDSGAANALKNFTWANIRETLKNYFDGLYNKARMGVISYKIKDGETVQIDKYEYLNIEFTEEYIIEGSGILTINGNGFLMVSGY